MFKQYPNVLGSLADGLPLGADGADVQEGSVGEQSTFLSQACLWWDEVAIPRVRQLLGRRDDELVSAYQRQHGQERDLRFELVPGQQVLLRQRQPGKLRTKCEGPYVFLRSVGPNSAALELLGPNGKVRVASVGNVVP